MPWAKLDDGMHSHPKFMQVSLGAVGLWTVGLSYAADYLTDGLVPRAVALGRGEDAPAFAAELVAAGLWDEDARGWVVHDYLECNPSRAQVESERAARSARAQQAAAKRHSKRPASAERDVTPEQRRADAPDPTRPDPSSTDVETDDSARGAVVVPPPPAVSEETDRVCDTLGQAGLNVYDRTAMQALLAKHPEVDGVEAAIRCANWARGKRAKHPLKALAPFLAAEDAPKRQIPQESRSKYDEGTIQGELS